jgi:aminopeptidase N/puromycin-sensitive aminopeptidase
MRPIRTSNFFCALFAVALLCSFGSSARAERLSHDVIPAHYTLTLTPDLKAATFNGVEQIDVQATIPVHAITLNSADIQIQSASVEAAGKKQTASVSFDPAREQVTLSLPQEIPAGQALIRIHYTGILNDKLRGFYLSKTKRRNYAVTQFESTDARRAFPSFDEPAFKATFDITLVVDKGDTAISNGPIIGDTPGPGPDMHTLHFLTTPRMSTYLVAFLVGDFQCTAGEQDGVAIRVCATPDKVSLTPFGLDVAKYVLHYYDNYFGIPYPLKKLDLIGLPDFEAGAMENFGAITYRETDLLIDPRTASIGSKKEVAEVIAHEMAHQWFGDLVTMQWWNNVWLNEGFATWMENKPVAAMHPEWHIDQDVVEQLDGTLNLDAQPTTRTIRAKADTREEIEQMFDGISYGKASDVLLMVENYLGEETFRKGVHAYLSAHLYGNATAEDFWSAQTETSHKPVDKIMDSLVAQPGVPLLTFSEPSGGRVSVAQRRFFLSPSINADPNQKWTLPVCFKSASSTPECDVLTPTATSLKAPSSALFFANAAGEGYYRSRYPADVYANIVAHVETDLTPTERISLLGDEWAQVRANTASVGDYLDLAAASKTDPNAAVINAGFGALDAVFERIATTQKERDALAAWVRRTYAPEYAKLPPPAADDSANTRELRAHLFAILGELGKDPGVLAQAREISEKYIADPASVDATLAQTALGIAARNGDEALFDKLQKVYETSTNPEIQIGALRLLAQFDNPALEERSLEYAVSGKVRNQDAAIQVAISMFMGGERRDRAWQFVQSNWNRIQGLLTPELGNVLVESTGSFCTEDASKQVQNFFSAHPVASADQGVKHAAERIQGCIELRSNQEPQLKTWLAEQKLM